MIGRELVYTMSQPVLIGALLTGVMLFMPVTASAQLSMSLATEDRHIYSADTARYVPVQRGSTTLFVEKVPRLTIPAEEIATVVVKHRQPDSSSSYDVIFALLPSGARRVAEFTAQQVGRYIEVRFGDTSLGVPRIVGPVGDGTIQGHLSGLPPERVHAGVRCARK